MIFAQNPYKSCAKIICNIYLTDNILQSKKIALPLHLVISFSVINYVVSMRHPRESDEVSFFLYPSLFVRLEYSVNHFDGAC